MPRPSIVERVMKRILLTGISGVAKSTITDELGRRGYTAVDADSDQYSEWVEVSGDLVEAAGSPVEAVRDWVWREDRIQELLSAGDAEILFVSGCAANMAAVTVRGPFSGQISVAFKSEKSASRVAILDRHRGDTTDLGS